jgi:DNA-binding transcriptional LysR family regulator
MSINLNMDCLRSFVSIVEFGSFSRAADHVGRTASAISLQMDRLQKQAGITLFRKDGRNRVITIAGTEFYEHARAILAQNDAALQIAAAGRISGFVRLGIVQDFAEDYFPQALNSFSEQFQKVRVEVLVERSRILLDKLEGGSLDQVIAFKHESSADTTLLRSSEMIWLGKPNSRLAASDPIPIVLVEGPCLFRTAALEALGKAGLPWEIKLTSPSLACVAAAAEAGIGVAVRTRDLLRRKQGTLAHCSELPKLPNIDLNLYNRSDKANPAVEKMTAYWTQQLTEGLV